MSTEYLDVVSTKYLDGEHGVSRWVSSTGMYQGCGEYGVSRLVSTECLGCSENGVLGCGEHGVWDVVSTEYLGFSEHGVSIDVVSTECQGCGE